MNFLFSPKRTQGKKHSPLYGESEEKLILLYMLTSGKETFKLVIQTNLKNEDRMTIESHKMTNNASTFVIFY